MSKVKFVSPSGKVVWLGEKVLQGTSIRQMGYRPYDEVYAPVHDIAPDKPISPSQAFIEPGVPAGKYLAKEFEPNLHTTEEKPKRGRPRAKNTVSDADQA